MITIIIIMGCCMHDECRHIGPWYDALRMMACHGYAHLTALINACDLLTTARPHTISAGIWDMLIPYHITYLEWWGIISITASGCHGYTKLMTSTLICHDIMRQAEEHGIHGILWVQLVWHCGAMVCLTPIP